MAFELPLEFENRMRGITDRNAGSMKQIGWKPDNRIQAVQVFDDVFPDCFFCTAAKQYTMRQQYGNTAICGIHVVNHMFYESKVSSRFGCQFSGSAISRVILQALIS